MRAEYILNKIFPVCVIFYYKCIAIAYKPIAHKPISARKKIKKTLYAEIAVTDSGQLLQCTSEPFPFITYLLLDD